MNVWQKEWWRLLAAVLVAGVIGLSIGFPLVTFAVGFALFAGWHLRQVVLLNRWLSGGAKIKSMPDLAGIWDQLALRVYQIKKASRERKRRLRSVISRFNSVSNAMPDAIVVLGKHLQIDWVNRAAQLLLGLHPRDVGQRIENLLRDPAFHGYIEARDFEQELELSSPVNPGVLLGIRIVPFEDGGFLFRARDMSEQAKVRRIRRDFVANVSHELRSPLTVLTGYLDAFQGDADIPVHLQRHMRNLAQQAERMNNLVEDLLRLSRMEGTTLSVDAGRPVAVGAILAAIVEEADNLGAVTGHGFSLRAEPGLEIDGVEAELVSVFSNLIMNAVQHTPAGSRVVVTWARNRDGEACFEVRDNGPGIAAEHLDRLTERFYRVDSGRSRDTGGTGLGLSIVKHALQRHNAKLQIQSESGSGTRMRCMFPADRVIVPRPDQAA